MASLKADTCNLWSEMFAPRKSHGGAGPANLYVLMELKSYDGCHALSVKI